MASHREANTTAYISAASAIVTAVAGTSMKTNVVLKYLGGTVFAAVVVYYLGVTKPARSDNYVTVFAGDKVTDCADLPALFKIDNIDKCSSITYLRGDLAAFRIANFHDYYNVSLILSGKTGLEFVSETAEKDGASK
jgi:hypothetical protein